MKPVFVTIQNTYTRFVDYLKKFNLIFFKGEDDLLIYKLTLIFMFFFIKSDYYLHVPVRLLSIYMLTSHVISKNKYLWAFLTFITCLINFLEKYTIDNHKYLATYWVITVFLSLFSENPKQYLEKNAKILVALCFGFATFWKFNGGEFLDGTFFHYKFITSKRLLPFVESISDFTNYYRKINLNFIQDLKSNPEMGVSVKLLSEDFLQKFAILFSYSVIIVEGLVATFFFLPDKWKIAQLRHFVLMGFIFSTYSLVSVKGFNYILVLMGIAQVGPQRPKLLFLYILTLAWTELKDIPWESYQKYFAYLLGI